MADSSFGLTVVLNSSKADYLAPVLNTDGYIVIIHDADNYPAVTSSNSLEMFPGQGEESYLRIFARVIDTDNSLYSFSPYGVSVYVLPLSFSNSILFHCLLASMLFSYGSEYANDRLHLHFPQLHYQMPHTQHNCPMQVSALPDASGTGGELRRSGLLYACPCRLPFQLPMWASSGTCCALYHLILSWPLSVKWNNVLTQRLRIPGLERESEEALFCPQCLPSCNDVQYSVSLNELPIDTYLASLSPDEVDTSLGTDLSVLRVFFGKPNANYYMRLLNNEWFEIFSKRLNIYIFSGN